jgi:hypothetical protein
MPPIPFILARAYHENSSEVRNDAPRILSRVHLTEGAKRAGVTAEEIAEWLDGGKVAQQEHYAKLAESPEWQALAERFGKPGLPTHASKTAPEDAAKRKTWATDMAKRQGWR